MYKCIADYYFKQKILLLREGERYHITRLNDGIYMIDVGNGGDVYMIDNKDIPNVYNFACIHNHFDIIGEERKRKISMV